MNKLFTYLILPLIAVISLNSFSQSGHYKCGTSEKMREMYAKNPGMEADRARLIQNSVSRSQEKSADSDTIIYTIPVVFHIIHQYGSENIPDANVYDQMLVLNRDYMLQNSDTTQIIPEFQSVKGKAYLQFKLASLDPWGNCTNGINHIYSHESTQGDNNSKLNGWHRSRYLNIWVVTSMENGVAGYSQYPSNDLDFTADGVIILKDYIGRLAPSNENSSRALTHEIGHYLGLSHVWGDNNDPGVECGDDLLPDTPRTMGYDYCPTPDGSRICVPPTTGTPSTPGIKENYQNYMDYSYCSFMFTQDQVDLMRENLLSSVAQRSDLITDSVHALTGIDVLAVPLCSPKADFSVSDRYICQGASTIFTDASWRAAVASRTWTFEGGTPATSTSATQSVMYDTPGFKRVTLSVVNATGTDELVQDKYIYVSPLWSDFTGPYSNTLEEGNANWFLISNPEDNYSKFQLNSGHGIDNSRCFKLNNYRNIDGALSYSPDWYHNKRMAGTKDILISPSYNLSNTTNVTVSFRYAYATNATQASDITEVMKVSFSRNCGDTWLYEQVISGATLVTAGFAGNTDFAPTNNTQWKEFTYNYNPTSSDTKTRVKIEFTSSDLSSNLYIDNFNISGTLGLFSNEIDGLELSVFPNPLTSQQSISVSYVAGENPVVLTLRDIQGKIIYTETVDKINTQVNHTIELGKALSSSCYFLEVKSGEFTTVKKVVVL